MECSAYMFFRAATALVVLYALMGSVLAVRRLRASFKDHPTDDGRVDQLSVTASSLTSWRVVGWLMFCVILPPEKP